MRMFPNSPSFWRDRIQASVAHFALSLVIALLTASLVFGIWYPYPYREVSGGRELFLLVVAVDIVLGPLITLAVFTRTKLWPELRRDLVVVVLMQLAALSYGLWTVSLARPVHMVFEYDRFRIVHAIEVVPELLAQARADVNALPITGPTLLALRPFADEEEKMNATLAALQGVSLASRPDLWQPYDLSIPEVLKAAKPAEELKIRFPDQMAEIERVLGDEGRTPEKVLYLPLVGRKSFWTVFLDPITAGIVATMPLDSF